MKRCLKLTFIFNLIIKLAFAQSIDELNSFKKNIFSLEDSSNIVKYIPKSKFNICFSGEYHVSWQTTANTGVIAKAFGTSLQLTIFCTNSPLSYAIDKFRSASHV